MKTSIFLIQSVFTVIFINECCSIYRDVLVYLYKDCFCLIISLQSFLLIVSFGIIRIGTLVGSLVTLSCLDVGW